MAKLATAFFPFRSPPAAGQPKFPACRAWRIIARPAADFSATAAAVVGSAVPQAPAGCKDGAYPVWVKATDPRSTQDLPGFRLIDGDGWHSDPMGQGWRIEYVGGVGAAATDRFAYMVEFLQPDDSLDTAGQANTPAIDAVSPEQRASYTGVVTNVAGAPANFNFDVIRPRGGRILHAWYGLDNNPATAALVDCKFFDDSGTQMDVGMDAASFGQTIPALTGWKQLANLGPGVISNLQQPVITAAIFQLQAALPSKIRFQVYSSLIGGSILTNARMLARWSI